MQISDTGPHNTFESIFSALITIVLLGFKRFAWPPPPEDAEVVPEIAEKAPDNSLAVTYTRAKTVPSSLIEPQSPPQRSWENEVGGRPVYSHDSSVPHQPYHHQPTPYKPSQFEPPRAFVKLRSSPPIQQVIIKTFYFTCVKILCFVGKFYRF